MRDVQQSAPPNEAEFRNAMGLFATGVCIVAVDTGAQGIVAMTINSFVSISLDPLLVSWSLQNDSNRFDLFADAQRFSISVLAADQEELALVYASREDAAVRVTDFAVSEQGLPSLKGALASFDCSAFAVHPGGDHTLILGEVTGLQTTHAHDAKALGFYQGEFISVSAN
ncbi:MAG: flavin reductase family protein [Pseudomonadota bacterium]